MIAKQMIWVHTNRLRVYRRLLTNRLHDKAVELRTYVLARS